jgi:hypothetical protein
MNARTLILTLAAVACAGATASAADAPKPLRTLVYDVQWDSTATRSTRDSGIGGAASGQSNAVAAAPDSGTMTIDVLAATNDGGLVVDAAFDGKTTKQPAARIALAENGSMNWNPGTEVAPQTRRLLPLLARGIVKDHDFTAGSTWTTPAPPPATGSLTYKVRQVEGTFATFDLSYTISTATMPRTDENGQATVSYDTFHVCPMKLDLQAHARRTLAMNASETVDYHLVARLVSDSLGSVKAQ